MQRSKHLDWPDGIERTPDEERDPGNKFSARFNRTEREIRKEMERLEVERWELDSVIGSGGDPGIVVRWTKDDTDYVVACDGYTSKKANIREVYLWLKETRKRNERLAQTKQDAFAAAAALPPGAGTPQPAVSGVEMPDDPYGFLNLTEGADDYLVKQAVRRKKALHHEDGSDPDREKWKQTKMVEEELLDDA